MIVVVRRNSPYLAHGGSRVRTAHRTYSAGFSAGAERRRLPGDFDIDVAIDTLYGAVWYKFLIRFETVQRAYIRKLVAQTPGDLEPGAESLNSPVTRARFTTNFSTKELN